MADPIPFGVYARLAGAQIRSQLEYRASFALLVLTSCLASGLDFVGILVLFGHVDALAGWSVSEVAFLYGTGSLSFQLADFAVGHADRLFTRVRTGDLDRLLARPLGLLGQLLAEDFALRRVGKLLQAAAVFSFALATVEVDWTIGRVVWLPVTVCAGAAIFGSMFVAGGAMAFWTTEGGEVAHAFTYGGNHMIAHPLGIYGKWLRRMATVVPLAFVNYLPATFLLGRSELLGFPAFAPFMSPLVAAVAVLGTRALWRAGLGHYRSTGS